jgi:antirestriction protein ArdC
MSFDIQATITNRIIEALESNDLPPWNRPWTSGPVTRPLRSCGQPYNGVNTLILFIEAQMNGYANPHWITFNQAKHQGGVVRKGEKGTPVVYFSQISKTDTNEDGDTFERRIPLLRYYTVFNAGQCDGLSGRFTLPPNPTPREFTLPEGCQLRHDTNKAYYSPSTDTIHLPSPSDFITRGHYLHTLLHELIHWTGASHRLNRTFGERFGDNTYAMEELTAELGASFLRADLGLDNPELSTHAAAYLKTWLAVLKSDKSAIFKVSAAASAAANLILPPEKEPEHDNPNLVSQSV